MRKIKTSQIFCFLLLSMVILTLAIATTWLCFGNAELGDFRGVTIFLIALVLIHVYAILVYRVFFWILPLELGEVRPGSRAEFLAQINILFYLMIFNHLVRGHVLPVPLMRFVYLGLGARMGQDSYTAGALMDPALTSIGDRCVIGHDAIVAAHVIEGGRFELLTVKIGNDVTIGGHAIIMPGVEVADGAIVSCGAIVTKGTRIGPGEIWAGVPARRIGHRAEQGVATACGSV
ncbi:DapH/DapD/GlmU-related protein [Accumulibacter sp.]|uniref:DapH/DapD/GlmU-related protein n=1 Tax=Accumulibacter sp. TaxID=2053492 RepID=UPI0025DFADD0|nr:DapH/DapD/GlmU-related protein [Accumulibacter sp.]MCM8594488.1 acyltransferase [Accumulibacter sp.]MDS4048634.1 DapH/DapD/GlmU-related protein [Accumulibacter sp.]